MSGSYDDILAKQGRVRTSAVHNGEKVLHIYEGASEGHVWVSGRRIQSRPGAKWFKKGCTDNKGMDHFARDHKAHRDKAETEGKEDGPLSSATGPPNVKRRGKSGPDGW